MTSIRNLLRNINFIYFRLQRLKPLITLCEKCPHLKLFGSVFSGIWTEYGEIWSISMLCYVEWNLFTVGSLQFPNDSTIASLEANHNMYSVQTQENTD